MKDMKTVTLYAKNVFGNKQYYPENELAQGLCDLLGQKTATPTQIEKMKRMGFDVQIIGDTK